MGSTLTDALHSLFARRGDASREAIERAGATVHRWDGTRWVAEVGSGRSWEALRACYDLIECRPDRWMPRRYHLVETAEAAKAAEEACLDEIIELEEELGRVRRDLKEARAEFRAAIRAARAAERAIARHERRAAKGETW